MKATKWEYQVKDMYDHELAEIKIPLYLNQKGQESWELVNVEILHAINDPMLVLKRKFYFKRKL